MKKKITSLVLIAVLAISSLSVTAFAGDPETPELILSEEDVTAAADAADEEPDRVTDVEEVHTEAAETAAVEAADTEVHEAAAAEMVVMEVYETAVAEAADIEEAVAADPEESEAEMNLEAVVAVSSITVTGPEPVKGGMVTNSASAFEISTENVEFNYVNWVLDPATSSTAADPHTGNGYAAAGSEYLAGYVYKMWLYVKLSSNVTGIFDAATTVTYNGKAAEFTRLNNGKMGLISICLGPLEEDTEDPVYSVEDFVTRLYDVCLDRKPDAAGLAGWVKKLESGSITGVKAAYGFVFSPEFKKKNLCNEDYVRQLYRAFMGREADKAGLENWVGKLESGMTREAVFNGFALSKEFTGLCEKYGISRGSGIAIPQYGTMPTGACSECGQEDGVTAFVTRLYRICFDRSPDSKGLADWCAKLRNHEKSGREVAYGFFFSAEFQNKKYSNENYVTYLYQAMMGRNPDSKGLAGWVAKLEAGKSRKSVFDGFVGSNEFTKICQKYGILRD